jgi:hypothetical protein
VLRDKKVVGVFVPRFLAPSWRNKKSHCHLLLRLFFRKNKIMFIKYDNLQLMCIIIHRLGGYFFFGDKQINPIPVSG